MQMLQALRAHAVDWRTCSWVKHNKAARTLCCCMSTPAVLTAVHLLGDSCCSLQHSTAGPVYIAPAVHAAVLHQLLLHPTVAPMVAAAWPHLPP
jgi:tRNA G26 N,N-dimethylase Trm1